MITVLINAYAVCPNSGSEPGMAWNWIVNLAKHCNLHIITEGEWKNEIEKALEGLPQKDNLQFYYNSVSEKVRRMCWNQGDWRFYYYYRQWQKKTLQIARQICNDHPIDVIHQLNMVGFREPGLLWKIEKIPFVWGPIGGMENIPVTYLKGGGNRQNIFCRIKNTINTLQYTYQPNVRKAIKRSNALIAAVKGVQDVLKNNYAKESYLIGETGCQIDQTLPVKSQNQDRKNLQIIWVGKFDFRKQLGLALRCIAEAKDLDISFHICGSGSIEQVKTYKHLASQLGVEDKCIWHGQVPHDKIQQMMADADLFFFTSIMEASSTVILEAISSGLPILCFNTCGFGPIVTKDIGEKIELSNPDQSIREFADKIKYFYHNRPILKEMSKNEVLYREKLSWENKAQLVSEIYKQTTTKKDTKSESF